MFPGNNEKQPVFLGAETFALNYYPNKHFVKNYAGRVFLGCC